MQTIFLSDLKAALLEHPQAWITQMEQQHWAQLRTIAEEIAEQLNVKFTVPKMADNKI